MLKSIPGDWEVNDKKRTVRLFSGKGKDKVYYDVTASADWKDSPEDVVESLNEVLKDKGLEFIHINDGSDTPSFALIPYVKRKKRGRKRSGKKR